MIIINVTPTNDKPRERKICEKNLQVEKKKKKYNWCHHSTVAWYTMVCSLHAWYHGSKRSERLFLQQAAIRILKISVEIHSRIRFLQCHEWLEKDFTVNARGSQRVFNMHRIFQCKTQTKRKPPPHMSSLLLYYTHCELTLCPVLLLFSFNNFRRENSRTIRIK